MGSGEVDPVSKAGLAARSRIPVARMSLLSPHQGEIRGSPVGGDARAESRWPRSMGLSLRVSRRPHARDSQSSRCNILTQFLK